VIKPAKHRAALAVVALLLTGAACTPRDGGAAVPPAGAPPKSNSQSSSPASSAQEAVAVYRAMWEQAVDASHTSDPKHPGLDDHATGGAYQLLLHMMRTHQKDGVVARGRPTFAPEVTSATASKVVIRDCSDASDWLMYTKDGQLENDVPGGHHLIDATVRKQGARWLVESLYIHEVGTCIA
jgi:hypothetical protein